MVSKKQVPKHGEQGASLVEYALLVALVAVVAMVGLGTLGNNIRDKFNNIGSTITNAGGGTTTGGTTGGTSGGTGG